MRNVESPWRRGRRVREQFLTPGEHDTPPTGVIVDFTREDITIRWDDDTERTYSRDYADACFVVTK